MKLEMNLKMKLTRRPHTLIAVLLATCAAGTASAHTAWLEPASDANSWELKFGGHAGKLDPVEPAKLKAVTALDAKGVALPVRRTQGEASVRIAVDGKPALLALHYDNGVHSSTGKGPSVNKPMGEVPGATRGTNAQKYHKTIVAWSAQVTRPQGQPFEVIPLSATPPRAGVPFAFEIRLDGKPLAV